MTPEQKELVRVSFAQVGPIADQAAGLFYDRLFVLDPSLRVLFPADLTAQRRNLMQMIAVAVAGLDRLDQIIPAVQALGQRHRGYGVPDSSYATVGVALIWTLEQGLGPAFTPATRAAWIAIYTLLSDTMLTASVSPAVAD